jgi:NitT/TauT family transport system substrate-binding protein
MKFSKQFSIVIATIVLILIIVLGSFFYYLQLNTVELKPIAVAYSPFESLTLFWVAQEQGYFKENGLNVTVHKHDSGADALTSVINGDADIAVGTTEFPLVIRALNQEQIKTMASISRSNFIYLVGRADRGIHNASDLEGKTIGTTFGTIAHYYLGRFLMLPSLT